MAVPDLDALSKSKPDLDLGERKAWAVPVKGEALRAWLLESPGFYPPAMFSHFLISVVSLEARDGWPAPLLYAADATGELAITGLRLGPVVRMEPPEILVQLCKVDVEDLTRLADVALVAAIGNRPPPIVDVQAGWHTAVRHWAESMGGRIELPPKRRGNFSADALRFA